jgi:hypothetical protein
MKIMMKKDNSHVRLVLDVVLSQDDAIKLEKTLEDIRNMSSYPLHEGVHVEEFERHALDQKLDNKYEIGGIYTSDDTIHMDKVFYLVYDITPDGVMYVKELSEYWVNTLIATNEDILSIGGFNSRVRNKLQFFRRVIPKLKSRELRYDEGFKMIYYSEGYAKYGIEEQHLNQKILLTDGLTSTIITAISDLSHKEEIYESKNGEYLTKEDNNK